MCVLWCSADALHCSYHHTLLPTPSFSVFVSYRGHNVKLDDFQLWVLQKRYLWNTSWPWLYFWESARIKATHNAKLSIKWQWQFSDSFYNYSFQFQDPVIVFRVPLSLLTEHEATKTVFLPPFCHLGLAHGPVMTHKHEFPAYFPANAWLTMPIINMGDRPNVAQLPIRVVSSLRYIPICVPP